MRKVRFLRRVKAAGLVTLLSGGTLLSACTSADIQKNIIAGSLAYVKGATTSFWDTFAPADDIWAGLFHPQPGVPTLPLQQ